MPFVDSSESMKARLHISEASKTARVGVVVMAVALLGLGGYNIGQLLGGEAFSLESSADVSAETNMDDAADSRSLPDAASSAKAELQTYDESTAASEAVASSSAAQSTLYVFVSGAVVAPGVYELPATARVDDAVRMAGGFSSDAKDDAVNLARQMQDGEQIYIPTLDQAEEYSPEPFQEQSKNVPDAGQAGSSASPQAININTASEEELQALPGVGPSIAAKIVASREAEGAFASVDDLTRVSGIGAKKLEALREYACV